VNRHRADLAVGLLVVLVLLAGGALGWQAARQRQAIGGTMGSMMGGSAGALHGPNPLWYGFGALLVAVAVGGLYLAVRDDLPASGPRMERASGVSGSASLDAATVPAEDGESVASRDLEDPPQRRVLDLLPDDERRVLEPVVTSPGITQIELRDRSDFSKSKVSQTVSALEKRGLLYRERQGRTYRVYPSDELREQR